MGNKFILSKDNQVYSPSFDSHIPYSFSFHFVVISHLTNINLVINASIPYSSHKKWNDTIKA